MKISLNKDYTLKIELEASERVDLFEMLRKCYDTLEKMNAWLEKASPEDQEKYKDYKQNLMMAISRLGVLCELAGISDKDINDYINIPL